MIAGEQPKGRCVSKLPGAWEMQMPMPGSSHRQVQHCQWRNRKDLATLLIQQNQFANYSTASADVCSRKRGAIARFDTVRSRVSFDLSPGLVVLPGSCAIGQSNCTSAAAFMNNLVAMDPDWSTFQTTYFPATAIPPGTPPALAAWAQSTDGQYTYLKQFGQHPADRGFNKSKRRRATSEYKREAITGASKRHGSREAFDLGHDPCRLRGPGLCPISA